MSQNSQSQRILWLIEELGIPYNLELHERQKSGKEKNRSPAELFKTHPLGKSPQLVAADGRVIAESSAVATYLIETYDTAGKFKGDGARNDHIRDEELSSLAGTSIGPMVSLLAVAVASDEAATLSSVPAFSLSRSYLRALRY